MPNCYILHSKVLDRYYIGSIADSIEERIAKHLSRHKGFTTKAKGWILVHKEEFESKNEARARELEISAGTIYDSPCQSTTLPILLLHKYRAIIGQKKVILPHPFNHRGLLHFSQ